MNFLEIIGKSLNHEERNSERHAYLLKYFDNAKTMKSQNQKQWEHRHNFED